MTMTTMTQGKVMLPTARPLPAISDVVTEKFISKREVARRLGKTIRTVDHWMKRGLLPHYKFGRTVSFKWSVVERRLEEFRVDAAKRAEGGSATGQMMKRGAGERVSG